MHTLSELRMYGRKALTGKWVPAALVVFVATLLGANNSINLNVSYTSPDKIANQLSNLDANLPPETFKELTLWFFIMGIALSLVAVVVGSVLRIGLSKYFIDLQDGKEVSFKTITEPFAKQIHSGSCCQTSCECCDNYWNYFIYHTGNNFNLRSLFGTVFNG